jgi:two-component system, cell cycle response regulator DivK
MIGPEAEGKFVLIVEDNPLNMKLFSAMVAAQGFGVLQATNGRRGLDMAHQHHPDLIIMDVNLPGMSGLEVTHSLKTDEDTSEIPIVITTAYGLGPDDPAVRASGCDGFMAKPIAVSEFLDVVECFMMRSLHRRVSAY